MEWPGVGGTDVGGGLGSEGWGRGVGGGGGRVVGASQDVCVTFG